MHTSRFRQGRKQHLACRKQGGEWKLLWWSTGGNHGNTLIRQGVADDYDKIGLIRYADKENDS